MQNMKRADKKNELVTFKVTRNDKQNIRRVSALFRKGVSAFVRDLALIEIGKWSTVIETEEPTQKEAQ